MKSSSHCILLVTAVAVLAVVDLCSTSAALAVPSTPEGFEVLEFTYKGKSSRLLWGTEKLLWFEAQFKCVEAGTHLVSPKTIEAQNALQFAIETLEIKGENWISLHRIDLSDTWKWGDGTPLTFRNWLIPDHETEFGGVVIFGSDISPDGKWLIHENKTLTFRYICE